MPTLSIKKDDLKFLNSGTGSIDIDIQKLPLDKPLDPSTPALLNANFNVAAGPAFSFGPAGDLKLSISAGTTATLTPYFATDKALDAHGLTKFFDANPHKYILALDIAAKAAADGTFTYKYSILSAGAELKAGADGEFWFSRAYDTSQNLGDVLQDLFSNLCPPSSVSGPLSAGNVIYLEYGGYLNFGLNASVGYEMQGTHSIDIANLLLSESYSLSILGKVGLTAAVAGNFSIQLRSGDTDPSWIHVTAQKKHSNQLSFAADVTVGLTTQSTGLPGSAQEFLGALLGVNAKNWLNFAQQIISSKSPDDLKKSLDSLSESFVTQWVGKGIDQLATPEFVSLLADANKIVTDYQNLDTTAINLFDKYFAQGEPALVQALQQLRHLTSLDQLATLYTNSNLTKFVEELTGGDPLAWILNKADLKDPAGNSLTQPILDIFNGRVEDALSLLQDDAHSLLKKYITLAKTKFSIDDFVNQLAGVTTIDGLKKKADDLLNGFIERIIGQSIDSIDKGKLSKVLTALQKINSIETTLYTKLTDTLNQTASLDLHAEYSRAAETDALLEIEVNPATAAGSQILHAASRGDFTGVMGMPITNDYRVMGGTLLDQLTRASKLTFNVAGWHSNFHYSSIESVILSTQQQIVAGDKGTLTVFTTIDLKDTEDIENNRQQLHATFLLRLIGETQGSINTPPAFDSKSQKYLMDTVTGMSASYELVLENSKATQQRVADFLKFATQFNLTQATIATVLPYMDSETSGGKVDYGDVKADYEVQFTDSAIARIFTATLPESVIRNIMRSVTLAVLVADESLQDVGWAYATPRVYQSWKNSGGQLINPITSLQFTVDPSPFSAPTNDGTVILKPFQISTLTSFFRNEDSVVAAFLRLQALVQSNTKLDPNAFATQMKAFSDSFSLFDKGMRTNAIFSVFDKLIAQTQPSASARGSSLKLTSTVAPNPTRTKVLLALPA
ncbi:MAG TPA: hypothetical protein VHA06_15815 [Candidatus Angelobacter sp.]|jgi:hypothetical protein|nr:hypothetical protein [Candidatus Angelobacter sp.]